LPGSAAYMISEAVRLRGRLDLAALQHAVDAVVARHEGLRTHFQDLDGHLSAVVDDGARVVIAQPPLVRDRPVNELLRKEVQRPFDLAAGPLIRVTVWTLDDDDHVLLLTVHHIVADGWSVGLLFRDLATA
jgi:NRPS condensation-like uncharacterized protein